MPRGKYPRTPNQLAAAKANLAKAAYPKPERKLSNLFAEQRAIRVGERKFPGQLRQRCGSPKFGTGIFAP